MYVVITQLQVEEWEDRSLIHPRLILYESKWEYSRDHNSLVITWYFWFDLLAIERGKPRYK